MRTSIFMKQTFLHPRTGIFYDIIVTDKYIEIKNRVTHISVSRPLSNLIDHFAEMTGDGV